MKNNVIYKLETISSIFKGIVCALFFVLFGATASKAQVENLVIETYYVADAEDATDTTQGRSLQPGMITYRIYLDLAEGTRLRKLFGNGAHPLRISSTDIFYNNIDRPNANFGFQINKGWIDDNPTIALDSWLTLGMASTQFLGIPKTEDSDATFTEITNNTGGTAAIAGGILQNNDPQAGIPLVTADGYMPNSTNVFGQWLDIGFKDLSNDDTTVFGPINIGNEFLSYNVELQQNNGVHGVDTIDNKVLVAQLTTLGELSFELNVEVEEFDGNNYHVVTYVANGDSIVGSELVSPFLTYPLSCGCTDPDYLEYSNAFACSVPEACTTLIVFGCMDPMACNYDSQANFELDGLCCYPGNCYDRDIALVCPQISSERFVIGGMYPSPASNELNFSCNNLKNIETSYFVYDATGKLVIEHSLGFIQPKSINRINIENLKSGLYFLKVMNGNEMDNRIFMKEN